MQQTEKMEIKMLVYNSDTQEMQSFDSYRDVNVNNEVAWVRLTNENSIGNENLRNQLKNVMHFEDSLIENIISDRERTNVMPFGERYYMTFRILKNELLKIYDIVEQENRPVRTDEISTKIKIVFTKNMVITIFNEPVVYFDSLSNELQAINGTMDIVGEVLYRIVQQCVEEIHKVINQDIEERIQTMHEEIMKEFKLHTKEEHELEIFELSEFIKKIRQVLEGVLPVFKDLKKIEFVKEFNHLIDKKAVDVYSKVNFENIGDHVEQIKETLTVHTETLQGLFDIQMSIRAEKMNERTEKMNEVMKTLTLFSSIFLPLTFISGLYGMNFAFIPETQWSFGYGYVWLLFLAVIVVTLIYFKVKKYF